MTAVSRGVVAGAKRRTGAKAAAALNALAAQTKDGHAIKVIGPGGDVLFAAKDGKVVGDAHREQKPQSGVAADRLRSFVERIERLEEEKAALSADLKEVYAEAKSEGWDAPTIRSVIRERKKDRQERAEQLSLFDLYWSALEGGA